MPQIGKRKPGDRSLPARDWNAVADTINGGVSNAPPPLNSLFSPTVLVRNDTGEDLDSFDCISLGEPLFALQADGSVDLVFAGEKADADKPAAICVEPIAHDASNKRYGRVWLYGLAYAFVGPAAAVTDLTAAPSPTNNRLAPGSGNVILLAAPSTTVEKLLPVLLSGSGDNAILAKTPGGGIPAASGSGPYTFGSASCTRVNSDGTVGSASVTVKNIVDQAIAGNVVIKAERVGSIYIVDVASCGS